MKQYFPELNWGGTFAQKKIPPPKHDTNSKAMKLSCIAFVYSIFIRFLYPSLVFLFTFIHLLGYSRFTLFLCTVDGMRAGCW